MNDSIYQHVSSNMQYQQDEVLESFVDSLKNEFQQSLLAVIFYGSCMRTREYQDAMLDFYVIIDNYHTAYSSRWHAIANRLLPPNVYYLQVQAQEKTYRAKYAVISKQELIKGVAKSFHSYFWARFSQPLSIVYAQDQSIKNSIIEIQCLAVKTFTRTVIGRLEGGFSSEKLWVTGLQLTYSAELRVETKQRASLIYSNDGEFYDGITESLLPDHYGKQLDPKTSIQSLLSWKVRILWGKILSVLRLMKATTTFVNGVDYIAWKIERHTGKEVEISEKLRKYPWIFCWPLIFRLYWQGKFR